MNRPNVEVPELEHDAMMEREFGRKVSANGRVERRIVAALCAHLQAHGFTLLAVFDGEERTDVHDSTKEAMELIFNLDEASLRVKLCAPVPMPEHGILLILGEGETLITDWNYTEGDPDGFNAAMEAFKVEDVL